MHSVSSVDPTGRFSQTVENYIKYRPGYPSPVIEFLTNEYGLNKQSTVADIGSGAGILTSMLLNNGNNVFAVEPNYEMRKAAEHALSDQHGFKSIDATAEATSLSNASIDFIIAAQAFHWFDNEKTKTEFKRISKKDAYIVLLWNMRDNDASITMRSYEKMLNDYAINYHNVAAENIGNSDISSFFTPNDFHLKIFPNKQVLDLDGFLGRILSTSYIPKQGHENHDIVMKKAQQIFDENNKSG